MRASHGDASVTAMKPAVPLLMAAALLAACQQPAVSPVATPSMVATVAPRSMAPESMSMSAEASASAAGALDTDALHGIELTDVRSGATVTLGALAAQKPLLVETMAIWCTNCRRQMHEVQAAHALADFHSVSIDVEAYEVAADLAAYAEQQGWDWPFAKADAATATALRERFGAEVLFPPGMPKILFRPDGSIELLPLGVEMPAADIAALVGG